MSRSSRSVHKLIAASSAAVLLTGALAGMALAQGDCHVSVAPATVAVGGQFTVSGNFGPAAIHLVRGSGTPPAEDATPAATTGDSGDFSVTFTAEAGDEGVWTVWAVIPETECGDSAPLTVTAAGMPDAAALAPSTAAGALAWLLALLLTGSLLALAVARR